MNKFLLSLTFGLCTYLGHAQSYRPLPDSNATWMVGIGLYNAYGSHQVATCDMPLSFGTDTVINGYAYHRLYGQEVCNWLNTYTSPPPPGTVTTGTDYYPYTVRYIFRQDVPGKKVYLYIPNENKDTLLYDFSSLAVGQPYPETILSPGYLGYMVQGHDSVVLNGAYYKRWGVGTTQYPNSITVIEGIGSSQGFATGFIPGLQNSPFESMYYLHCFTQNGVTLFAEWPSHFRYLIFPSAGYCQTDLSVEEGETEQLAVYPNPARENLYIQGNMSIAYLYVNDMQGRSVLQQKGTGTTERVLDVSALEAGCYTVTVQSQNGKRTMTKFIKEN